MIQMNCTIWVHFVSNVNHTELHHRALAVNSIVDNFQFWGIAPPLQGWGEGTRKVNGRSEDAWTNERVGLWEESLLQSSLMLQIAPLKRRGEAATLLCEREWWRETFLRSLLWIGLRSRPHTLLLKREPTIHSFNISLYVTLEVYHVS